MNGPTSVDNGKMPLKLPNPHIEKMSEDILYHLALGTKTHDLKSMFGDIKFVVLGGSPRRMEMFAYYMLDQIDCVLPTGQTLMNIAGKTDRYVLFKVGPVLIVSHGMGIPSIQIVLHEVIKLIHHAQCTDVLFFRIGTCGGLATQDVTILRLGTCGGIGLRPGSVVVSDSTVDGLFKPYLEMAILGKLVKRPSELDNELVKDLMSCPREDDEFSTVCGKTMCTLDFYEGQARLDGAFCDYTEEDKINFLQRAHQEGVCNIEMESLCFAAMCCHAKVKGAVVCVTILDRLKGDQVSTPHETLKEWDQRPAQLIARLIRKKLGLEK
ncbi:Uridine phosphorylase 2 [Lamellibrachia satsuma]|nr:Uridine phosphorylase 2 [Lamellibrachia satsuma]